MIERIAIQHAKMNGVDWSCVTGDEDGHGLNVRTINQHLARVELSHGAHVQLFFLKPPLHLSAAECSEFYRNPYCWLYLAADGKCWAVERLGRFYSLIGWENLLDLRDFLNEKLPGLRLSWRAYNESRLWC